MHVYTRCNGASTAGLSDGPDRHNKEGLLQMSRQSILRCAAAIVPLFAICSVASAQLSGQQTFIVNVPANMLITPPSPGASLTHDESDNDQIFPNQQWQVRANSRFGATVVFSTNQAFTHTLDNTFVRDARLDLAISSATGPANWTLAVASDQTDYVNGNGIATVQAQSDRPGQAVFDLTVTFVTTDWDTLASGDYATVVTGTLSAN